MANTRLVGFDRGLVVPEGVARKVEGTSYGAHPVKPPEYVPFPDANPQCRPAGFRVLVQIRQPRTHVGRFELDLKTQEAEKWHQSIAKVIALGPRSYKDRETGAKWPEGNWCEPGDYVRIPKHGNDRFEIGGVLFAIINDDDVLGVITGDPAAFTAYIAPGGLA